jgi:hypothetical protein
MSRQENGVVALLLAFVLLELMGIQPDPGKPNILHKVIAGWLCGVTSDRVI